MSDTLALIADIGGTNVRFALVGADGVPTHTTPMRCADFKGPAEAAKAFLAAVAPRSSVDRAAFAVASPVTGDRIDLTNSAWNFSVEMVRRDLGLDRLDVVNDFTAVALSIPHLTEGDLLKVGGGEPAADAAIAVLGPGTGLGVSTLVPVGGGRYVPLPGEGGHVTMAATDEREAALLAILRKRFGHVSAERVLSGPGLVNLYEALATFRDAAITYTSPDAISQRGLDNSCPICREALDTFFGMLGSVAGNLALSVGARGGVYIAGGILPRMKAEFAQSGFRSRFEDKGRFNAYLAPIPTWLITHPQPAFAGLAGLVKA